MPQFIVVSVALVTILIVGFFMFLFKGPDFSQFEDLIDPRITVLENQKVIVVKASGDPEQVGGKAIGLLFQLYFKLKDVPKGPNQPAPRARWPVSLDVAKSEWVGWYAMPVPEHVTSLPTYHEESALEVELTTWEYGEVAEILHIGPYEEETPTIEKLKAFITESGYEISGPHEEEYLRGPGMLPPVKPEAYYTLIRYQVKKASD